jgi:PTS system mannitol-specific IIC component
MTTEVATQKGSGRVAVQKFGTFLSGMIMPNIAAIIAWGIITAFFIPVGWTPNAAIATMVTPILTYLLPSLIAFTGGKMVYDHRGGVVGAVATMGVILGTSDSTLLAGRPGSTMFLGAMIMGPLTAWLMKKIDSIWDGKIAPGFEMLVDNFSAGILAAVMAIASLFLLAPVMLLIMGWLSAGVGALIATGLLPLASILIEPAKVFFLNNAINHGVLTPLGIEMVKTSGKSILFLLEANPGPGLGILLAYSIFGKGNAKASAPGAAIIHFLGGIHEIYFPFVLMRPILILAMVAGGMTGVFVNVVFNVGLRAPAAPGSILAVYAQTAPDSFLGVTISWIAAAAVTLVVGAILLRLGKNTDEGDLVGATAEMEAMKGKKSSVGSLLVGAPVGVIKTIVFACDAGMGSSAMGASVLRKKIQAAGFSDVTVVNKAIANLDDSYDVVVSHQDLIDRAAQKTPSAVHVSVDNFMASPKYDDVVEMVKAANSDPKASEATPVVTAAAVAPVAVETTPARAIVTEPAPAASAAPVATATGEGVLKLSSIVLSGTANDQVSAIDEAGTLLVDAGAVDAGYVNSMHDREKSVSTYMGNFLAIPHGTNEAKGLIKSSAISVVRYPDGIDWNGNPVKFVIGIAGANDEHLELLSKIAEVFLDTDAVAALEKAGTREEIADTFKGMNS